MRRLDSNGSISAISSATPHQTLPAVGESDGDDRSESGKTVTSQYNGRDQNHRSVEDQEKMRKSLVEGLWKSVMEPALEYSIVSASLLQVSFDLYPGPETDYRWPESFRRRTSCMLSSRLLHRRLHCRSFQ